jgi:uncharacterized protein (DUF1697 family)
MTGRYAALVRGVNVGRGKRVAMAGLRKAVEGLGYRDVRTLLNSGNVVFTAPGCTAAEAAASIEGALVNELGVTARVITLTAGEVAAIAANNPLSGIAGNPSRLLAAVLADPADCARLEPLLRRDWPPEALALGGRAAYLWCPAGVLASRLPEAVSRAAGDAVTMRNWATLTKIHAAL